MTAFDLKDPRSPSGRIEGDIKQAVDNGRLQPGEKLPSYNELAKTYGVDKNTAMAAIQRLRNQRYVYIKQGVGAFVVDQGQLSPEASSDDVAGVIAQHVASINAKLEGLEARVEALEAQKKSGLQAAELGQATDSPEHQ